MNKWVNSSSHTGFIFVQQNGHLGNILCTMLVVVGNNNLYAHKGIVRCIVSRITLRQIAHCLHCLVIIKSLARVWLQVEYLDEQRLHQLGVDLQEELDVRVVEPVQVLHPADQVQVGPARRAPGIAGSLQVPPQQVVVGVLQRMYA